MKCLQPRQRELIRSSMSISSMAHCVQELVENAVIAGARHVRVCVDLTRMSVLVTDDGRGVPAHQLPYIGNRNYTGWLGDEDDIEDYGHRGESLANITAISHWVKVKSRFRGESQTWSRLLHRDASDSVTTVHNDKGHDREKVNDNQTNTRTLKEQRNKFYPTESHVVGRGAGSDKTVRLSSSQWKSCGTEVGVFGLFLGASLNVRVTCNRDIHQLTSIQETVVRLALGHTGIAFKLVNLPEKRSVVEVGTSSSRIDRHLQLLGNSARVNALAPYESREFKTESYIIHGPAQLASLKAFNIFINGGLLKKNSCHSFAYKQIIRLARTQGFCIFLFIELTSTGRHIYSRKRTENFLLGYKDEMLRCLQAQLSNMKELMNNLNLCESTPQTTIVPKTSMSPSKDSNLEVVTKNTMKSIDTVYSTESVCSNHANEKHSKVEVKSEEIIAKISPVKVATPKRPLENKVDIIPVKKQRKSKIRQWFQHEHSTSIHNDRITKLADRLSSFQQNHHVKLSAIATRNNSLRSSTSNESGNTGKLIFYNRKQVTKLEMNPNLLHNNQSKQAGFEDISFRNQWTHSAGKDILLKQTTLHYGSTYEINHVNKKYYVNDATKGLIPSDPIKRKNLPDSNRSNDLNIRWFESTFEQNLNAVEKLDSCLIHHGSFGLNMLKSRSKSEISLTPKKSYINLLLNAFRTPPDNANIICQNTSNQKNQKLFSCSTHDSPFKLSVNLQPIRYMDAENLGSKQMLKFYFDNSNVNCSMDQTVSSPYFPFFSSQQPISIANSHHQPEFSSGDIVKPFTIFNNDSFGVQFPAEIISSNKSSETLISNNSISNDVKQRSRPIFNSYNKNNCPNLNDLEDRYIEQQEDIPFHDGKGNRLLAIENAPVYDSTKKTSNNDHFEEGKLKNSLTKQDTSVNIRYRDEVKQSSAEPSNFDQSKMPLGKLSQSNQSDREYDRESAGNDLESVLVENEDSPTENSDGISREVESQKESELLSESNILQELEIDKYINEDGNISDTIAMADDSPKHHRAPDEEDRNYSNKTEIYDGECRNTHSAPKQEKHVELNLKNQLNSIMQETKISENTNNFNSTNGVNSEIVNTCLIKKSDKISNVKTNSGNKNFRFGITHNDIGNFNIETHNEDTNITDSTSNTAIGNNNVVNKDMEITFGSDKTTNTTDDTTNEDNSIENPNDDTKNGNENITSEPIRVETMSSTSKDVHGGSERSSDTPNSLERETNSNTDCILPVKDWNAMKDRSGQKVYVNLRSGLTSLLTPPSFSTTEKPIPSQVNIFEGMLFSGITYNDPCMARYEKKAHTLKNMVLTHDFSPFVSRQDSSLPITAAQCPPSLGNAPKIERPIKQAATMKNPSLTSTDCQISPKSLENIMVFGQVDNKFIVGSIDENIVVLLDQHAVSERIHLEKILKANGVWADSCLLNNAPLYPPIFIELDQSTVRILTSHTEAVRRCGFQLLFPPAEEKNEKYAKIGVKTVPSCLAAKKRDSHEMVRHVSEIVKQLADSIISTRSGGCSIVPPLLMDLYKSQACHSAVRFGDSLTLDQCRQLINDLKTCRLPLQCAHGRPSIIPIAVCSDYLSAFTEF